MVAAQHLPSPAQARLDLVCNEQRIVLVQQLFGARQVASIWDNHTGLSLHSWVIFMSCAFSGQSLDGEKCHVLCGCDKKR